eukprot:GFYU01001822.1.p1 GENE.GFYU01001822.1~~GFYU01001822.1.p1  ORF type:complete len:531 (-),score=164.24 GFYU01001822.1:120-1712(-)
MAGISANEPVQKEFGILFVLFEALVILFFGLFVRYDDSTKAIDAANAAETITRYYPFYQDVHVMIFVGFGFLYMFLKKYYYTSIAMNFLIAAATVQWVTLTDSFWHRVFLHDPDTPSFDCTAVGTTCDAAQTAAWEEFTSGKEAFNERWTDVVHMDITTLITGDFGAGAVLITFGVILGRSSPAQLLVILFFECIFYSLNLKLCEERVRMVDMGGSMMIHLFGAVFGLALSRVLTSKKCRNPESDELDDHPNNGASYTSDGFAMLGTIFLWMYWPSFNGALAPQQSQHRVAVNTVMSLTGSCIAAFIWSFYTGRAHKFDMVHIQNATIAGGVAVGSSADLVIEPYGAIIIGLVAGSLSVVGYHWVSPWLQRSFGLHDTCGVNNLHGMPGFLGGISGAISAATATSSEYGSEVWKIFPARNPHGDNRSAQEQAGYQLVALICTLGIATVGGIITGYLASWKKLELPRKLFDDELYWDLEETEMNSFKPEYLESGEMRHRIRTDDSRSSDDDSRDERDSVLSDPLPNTLKNK